MPKRIPSNLGIAERTEPTKFRRPRDIEKAEEQVRSAGRMCRVRVDRIRANAYQDPGRDAAVTDLAESIAAHGIIHAPVVRQIGPGWYEAVVGHRRIAAWSFLVFSGRAEPRLVVSVLPEIDDRLMLRLMIAENHHREAPDVLQEAETLGRYAALLAAELGRDPTVRELAAEVPPGRTSVQRLLTIHRALEDPELGQLVRGADIQDKSLLYRVLRAPCISTTRTALQCAAAGGSGKDIEAILAPPRSRGLRGRPPKPVSRTDLGGGGYDLTLRVRPTTPAEDLTAALAHAERAVADLRTRLAEAGGA